MKTNLMKSILHLKDDTEYQIPLRETENDNRAEVVANKENKADEEEATATQSQGEQKSKKEQLKDNPTAKKKPNEISQEEVTDEEEATATQSQDDVDATKVYEEDPDETQNQEQSNTEEDNNNTTTESVPPTDIAKAALDEMKKLASQEGVIHPSLFISNFSKILGLMERAMQLQVKESGSATEESGSVTKEEAPKATEQTETLEKTEVPEQTETPAEGNQGELNGNTNRS